jgi:tRNA (cmo5U34)-methyltransferase
MSLAAEFDTWQNDYTAKILRWVPHYRKLINSLADELPTGFQPSRILDLGCGNGNATALLAERFPKAKITLLDASPEMIEACKQRFSDRPDFEYVESYFQDAHFEDGSLDLIVAAFALHHLDQAEKQATFKKMSSWLKVGGILSSSDLHASKREADYQQRVLDPWEAFSKSQGTSDSEWDELMAHHSQYDKPDNYEDQFAWLAQAGFEQTRIAWQAAHFGNFQAQR